MVVVVATQIRHCKIVSKHQCINFFSPLSLSLFFRDFCKLMECFFFFFLIFLSVLLIVWPVFNKLNS